MTVCIFGFPDRGKMRARSANLMVKLGSPPSSPVVYKATPQCQKASLPLKTWAGGQNQEIYTPEGDLIVPENENIFHH